MATLALTFTGGQDLRRLSQKLEQLASGIPDILATGGTSQITFDSAPSSGTIGIQISSGPHSGPVHRV